MKFISDVAFNIDNQLNETKHVVNLETIGKLINNQEIIEYLFKIESSSCLLTATEQISF